MQSRWVGLAVGVLGVASCNFSPSGDGGNGNGSCTPGSPRVCMIGTTTFSFSPKNLTVTAGATVTWQNETSVPHTVNAARDSKEVFSSGGDVPPGTAYAHVFDHVGTYPYYCIHHGTNTSPPTGMWGTITVQAAP